MRRIRARRLKPSSGLEPETPSLPFKSRLSQRVPACSTQSKESLEISDSRRDGQEQRNPRWNALMLPDCCPSVSPIKTTAGPLAPRGCGTRCSIH